MLMVRRGTKSTVRTAEEIEPDITMRERSIIFLVSIKFHVYFNNDLVSISYYGYTIEELLFNGSDSISTSGSFNSKKNKRSFTDNSESLSLNNS